LTRRTIALAAATFSLLCTAWADVTGTVAMTVGVTLDLDTGAIGTGSAADVLYTGANGVLAPLSNGTLLTISNLTGSDNFNRFTQVDLARVTTYSSGQIPDGALTPGVILLARTKSGKYCKIFIVSKFTGNMALQFTTFTASLLAPSIDSVQNNYGPLRDGYPGSALAPGSLIAIKGLNLSLINDGQTLRSSASPGLQNAVNGVSVTVAVNGISLNCPLYYLSPTQINAILPGNTPLGRGTIFVTSDQNRGSPFGITVVQSSFGIVHYSGTLAATYDTNNALVTGFNAANPLQTIVIWGSGVGNDPANDDRLFPQKTNNLVNVPMQVLVGGRAATITYRGRSQFPGVDQIVATLPSNVPTGCYVPLSVVTGDIVSNGVTIPVAATGKTCSDPDDRFTPAVIQTLSAKAATNTGTFYIGRFANLSDGTTSQYVFGSFFSTNGFGLSAGYNSLSIGNCLTTGSDDFPGDTRKPLDAGLTIQVIGPKGNLFLAKAASATESTYNTKPPGGFIPAAGGDFIIDNFPGGMDVQRISTPLSLPLDFTWTNPAALATVDRRGATVTWSGGFSATYVEIQASGGLAYSFFRCLAPVSAGQFTIPASVLLAVPQGSNYLTVSAVYRTSYSPPFLDFFKLEGVVGITANARF
jgi:uncharacterized protein (TIGR03437 family)